MAHFAKLDNNNVVVFVTAGRDEDEHKEQELTDRTGEIYKRTSYNTKGGIHYNPVTGQPSEDQSKAFRKNYAGIGYSYDQQRDAFIPPKPFNSWILNESTCNWESPVVYPTDGKKYEWNEETLTWIEISNN
jgi:hypothetical protein